ncbi:unnamed protein product [Soboliphyme baturini]|uniref:Uncharacterized protein n=1 Tax=Soboliphyme baturini TaxID=241478 RepID=A0A183IH53_9BILA|nr:unnamed protein product [Soboliphyme baturini]
MLQPYVASWSTCPSYEADLSSVLVIKREAAEREEKFKYLEIVFAGDEKFEEEIGRRIGVASGDLLDGLQWLKQG